MVIKWIKSNILDLIQSVGLVGVVVAALIAWLQRVPWYLALLGLLAAVVLILFGINQYETRKERHKKKLTQLSDKELENRIRAWVSISAWSIRPLDLKDDLLLGYELTFAEKKSLVVSRHKKEPDVIYLGTEIQFTSQKTKMSDADWE